MADKSKRSIAKGRFTRHIIKLDEFIGRAADSSAEVGDKLLKNVEQAWENLEDKHEEYVSQLLRENENTNTEDEDKWISVCHESYEKIIERYVKFKTDCVVVSERYTKEKVRTIEYESFLKMASSLQGSLDKGYPIETIFREKNLLEKQFEKTRLLHSEFCTVCDRKDEKRNSDWLAKFIEEFAKFNSVADSYPVTKNFDDKKPCTNPTPSTRPCMRMEQIPLPKFNEEPRCYLRFKKDFMELVLPNLEEREAVFTLRQCLDREVDSFIGFGDFSLDKIFIDKLVNI